MPYIILPDKWKSQPTYAASIDWGNPLTRNLITAPLLSLRGAFHDPATFLPWSNTNLTFTETERGVAATGAGSEYADGGVSGLAYPFSGAVLFRVTTLATRSNILGLGSTSVMRAGLFSFTDYGDPIIVLQRISSDTTNLNTTLANEIAANVWQFASFTVLSSTSAFLYCNRKSLEGVGSNECQPSTYTNLRIGGNYNSTSNLMTGSVAFCAVWNRKIEQGEHLALFENPWQFYRKDVGTVYFIPTAVAGISKPVAYHHRQTQGLAA